MREVTNAGVGDQAAQYEDQHLDPKPELQVGVEPVVLGIKFALREEGVDPLQLGVHRSGVVAQDAKVGPAHQHAPWPGAHSRESSATAFLAQASSTMALPSAAPAMRAAVATLLSARGSPLENRCIRATASSAKTGSLRHTSVMWWRR